MTFPCAAVAMPAEIAPPEPVAELARRLEPVMVVAVSGATTSLKTPPPHLPAELLLKIELRTKIPEFV